jgi:hypothetical protein
MKKGEKMTKEQRERIGLQTSKRIKEGKFGFQKGFKPTEQHLKNLSLSHLGQKAWNKGMKMDDKFREKCRARQLGKFVRSEEGKRSFKQKMSGQNHWRWTEDRSEVDLNKRRWCTKECIEWREPVFLRDGHKCKIANEDCCADVEAHHILSWREYPELRFNINNGITLCRTHHPRKRSEEKRLVSEFQNLVSVSKELQS